MLGTVPPITAEETSTELGLIQYPFPANVALPLLGLIPE